MAPPLTPTSDLAATREEIDPGLLKDTQAYLVYQSQHQTPPRHLVKAWEQFYRCCDPLLRQFAGACQVPANARDDCVQQVWEELLKSLPRLDYDPRRGSMRSWLYTVVHSKATDLLRRTIRHAAVSLPPEVANLLQGREEDPATEYERNQRCAEVQYMLAELRRSVSERNYAVLHLHWIEGHPVAEVAAALGLTPAQVWVREHRLKRKLQRLFRQHLSAIQIPP
jgi:RNA polymerase sigma factor (sigma-70 family)